MVAVDVLKLVEDVRRLEDAVRYGVIRWLLVMRFGSKYVCIYIFSVLVAS